MEIVTGSTGVAHVTPIDDAVRNSNTGYANDRVVFTYYENFEARAITANEVRVFSGYGMNQGRLFKIAQNTYDSVTIENGASGKKRADLIVARYTLDTQTGFEDISLVVIKGTPDDSEYVDPEYNTYNINNGGTIDDFPLYRVKLNGIVIEDVEQMFRLLPDGGRFGVFESMLNTDMLVDLEKDTAGNLSDCENEDNLDLGIKGVLPITHGGTGGNSAASAAKNILIDAMSSDTDTPTDTTEFVTSEAGSGFSQTVKKRSASNIWNYIRTKVKSLLGMNTNDYVSVAHGGTGKGSIGNKKVLVGNSSGGFDEYEAATTLSNPDDTHFPTTKAVNDALSAGGYGDMLSSEWTQNGYLKDTKGGIGARGFETGDPSSAGGTAVATSGALYAVKTALAQSFQAGVDLIYNAIVACGVTPASSTPSDCAVGIVTLTNITWTDEVTVYMQNYHLNDNGGGFNFYLPLIDVINASVTLGQDNPSGAAEDTSGWGGVAARMVYYYATLNDLNNDNQLPYQHQISSQNLDIVSNTTNTWSKTTALSIPSNAKYMKVIVMCTGINKSWRQYCKVSFTKKTKMVR